MSILVMLLIAIGVLVGIIAVQNNFDWKLTLAALTAMAAAAWQWFIGLFGAAG